MAIAVKTMEMLPNVSILGSFTTPVTGVSIDTRQLQAGDLFVAFLGTQVDGHDFIPKAISRGASAVMASSSWEGCKHWEASIPLIITNDPVESLAHLATAHRKTFDIPLIAITGTNGKTSTKNMLAHILRSRKKVLSTQGNLNNHIGLPMTLLKLNEDHDVAVIEMGASKAGDIAYLCQIAQPTQGMITNISLAHTEFFMDIETIQRTKGELFSYLGANAGRAYVNIDDPRVHALGAQCPNPILFGFSEDKEHVFTLESPDQQGRYSLLVDGHRIKLPQAGKVTALNAAAAATIALQNGILYSELVAALENYPGESGRMQMETIADVTFYHDAYNANPASTIAGIETMDALESQGKRYLILGDMLELGAQSAQLHQGLADRLQNARFDFVFLYGREVASTARRLDAVNYTAYFQHEDKNKVLEAFLNRVRPHDLVYLKGSRGMAMESFMNAYKEMN